MSPEYPDLKFVRPKSWTYADRSSVQLIVIHTTEGSAHELSAEDGAAYDARRTDGTSTHYFHDDTSTVQCVLTADIAHTAKRQGNRRGIQHELCGRAGWSQERWNDDYSNNMLRRAAKQAARDARKWGIPVRHLTAAQVAAGEKGFCSHWDITRAFPADNGTHTDPGPNFPWTRFLNMVRAELEGKEMTGEEWVRMEKLVEAVAIKVWTAAFGRDANRRTAGELLVEGRNYAASASGKADELDVQMDLYAAEDAARDALVPVKVREALTVGAPPEQVAEALKQVSGVDWPAVGRALAA